MGGSTSRRPRTGAARPMRKLRGIDRNPWFEPLENRSVCETDTACDRARCRLFALNHAIHVGIECEGAISQGGLERDARDDRPLLSTPIFKILRVSLSEQRVGPTRSLASAANGIGLHALGHARQVDRAEPGRSCRTLVRTGRRAPPATIAPARGRASASRPRANTSPCGWTCSLDGSELTETQWQHERVRRRRQRRRGPGEAGARARVARRAPARARHPIRGETGWR